ncbi:MAG: cysteine desulfurase [Oscillospiraceae bacterium]|nr:cysteine desulfurase [Oscillospiraceae bacterium]
MIYLDYAANYPTDKEVLKVFCETEHLFIANPNSNHIGGLNARAKMHEVTESIASMLGVDSEEIIYTSGASESNNTAIKGIARSMRHNGKHIISTPLEHPSVSMSLATLKEQGWEIDYVRIGRDGKVDLDDLKELIRNDTTLLCATAVDSELGTIQPISEISEVVKSYPNCRLHVDATQAIGKIKFSFDGIDTAAIAPHKFGGLNGSGLLIKKRNVDMEPLIHGGAGTTLYRSGTPALSLAVSTEKALAIALDDFDKRLETVTKLNLRLREELSKYPNVRFNSPDDAVPHILNLSVNGIMGTTFQKALSEKDICVSVKSACSSDGTPSKAVLAVSGDRKNALSSWRISLGHLTTDDEIDKFLNAFDEIQLEMK